MNKTTENFFIIFFIAIVLSLYIFYQDDNDTTINVSDNKNEDMLNNLINYASETINVINDYILGNQNYMVDKKIKNNIGHKGHKDRFSNTINNNSIDEDEEFIQDLFETELKHKKDVAIGANKIISVNDYVVSMKDRVGHLNNVLESNLKRMRNKGILYNTNGELTRND